MPSTPRVTVEGRSTIPGVFDVTFSVVGMWGGGSTCAVTVPLLPIIMETFIGSTAIASLSKTMTCSVNVRPPRDGGTVTKIVPLPAVLPAVNGTSADDAPAGRSKPAGALKSEGGSATTRKCSGAAAGLPRRRRMVPVPPTPTCCMSGPTAPSSSRIVHVAVSLRGTMMEGGDKVMLNVSSPSGSASRTIGTEICAVVCPWARNTLPLLAL